MDRSLVYGRHVEKPDNRSGGSCSGGACIQASTQLEQRNEWVGTGVGTSL